MQNRNRIFSLGRIDDKREITPQSFNRIVDQTNILRREPLDMRLNRAVAASGGDLIVGKIISVTESFPQNHSYIVEYMKGDTGISELPLKTWQGRDPNIRYWPHSVGSWVLIYRLTDGEIPEALKPFFTVAEYIITPESVEHSLCTSET